jgi:hypothetical protein
MTTENNKSVTTETPNGVKTTVTKGAITLDRIYKGDYQKEGTLTAQIRQEVMKHSFYPSKKVASSMQANIFSTDDFGFEGSEYESKETRIAWIPVPENISQEEVLRRLALAETKGATIYRVLSNAPILDENQVYAISQGLTTKDKFANSQAVRFPESAGENAGKLQLDSEGRVQYRRTFFWGTAMEDQDARGKTEAYVSPELQAELAGASVMQGQTI